MTINWPVTLAFSKTVLTFAGAASWPAAAAYIAMHFKDPISGAIGRAKSVKVWGAEVELPVQPTNQSDTGATAVTGDAIKNLSVTPTPPVDDILSPRDTLIRNMIEKEPLSPEQKYAWAVRQAAIYAATADFERIYRLSYGSQLKLLKQANMLIYMTVASVKDFFDMNRNQDLTAPTYNFDAWLRFMVNSGLVDISDISDIPQLQLTANGRAFLLWMVEQRVVDEKPF